MTRRAQTGRGSIQTHARTSVAAKSSPLNSKGAYRGKRVGGAIREIEPRRGMNALAVAVEGGGGDMHLRLVERDNFNFAVRQQLPETRDGGPWRTRKTVAVSCALTADMTQRSSPATMFSKACFSGSSKRMAIRAELSTTIIGR